MSSKTRLTYSVSRWLELRPLDKEISGNVFTIDIAPDRYLWMST